MYKIKNNLDTKFSFTHIREKDINNLNFLF